MCEVFPRVASCTYWKYGTGGHPVGLQALCILSLNIVIDKVMYTRDLDKLIFRLKSIVPIAIMLAKNVVKITNSLMSITSHEINE